MIDFKNAEFMKLRLVDNAAYADFILPNVQGITGKKKDCTSLPYSKIQAYSVETAGHFDLDSELELWFSGLGKVKLEFVSSANVAQICRFISAHVL